MATVEIECESCDGLFEVPPSREHRRFCSVDCYHASLTPRVELTCEGCGDTFELPPSWADGRRFCSWECFVDAGGPAQNLPTTGRGHLPDWLADRADDLQQLTELPGRKPPVDHLAPLRS